MTNDDLLLLQTSVFTGITTDEIRDMLSCLSARETTFIKDEIIFSYGETITGIGIVLEGSVHIVKEDFWGNANLMAECAPGDIFGEAYAINSTEPLEMNIFAASTCRILFLEVSKILTVCPSACAFHNRLIRNLLTLVSRKNFQLNRKLEHMSKRTTREKLLSYLSMDYIKYLKDYDSLLAMGVLFATPVPAVIYGRIKRGMLGTLAIAVIFALSMYYLAVSANNPFLYFNF